MLLSVCRLISLSCRSIDGVVPPRSSNGALGVFACRSVRDTEDGAQGLPSFGMMKLAGQRRPDMIVCFQVCPDIEKLSIERGPAVDAEDGRADCAWWLMLGRRSSRFTTAIS